MVSIRGVGDSARKVFDLLKSSVVWSETTKLGSGTFARVEIRAGNFRRGITLTVGDDENGTKTVRVRNDEARAIAASLQRAVDTDTPPHNLEVAQS